MALSDVDLLDGCRLLRYVSGAAREGILGMGRRVRFPAGERIFDQGDPCPGLYVLGSGLVRVYKISPAGKEHVLHLVSPGQTFAEVAAIGGFACPAHAEALADTDCLLLPTAPLVEALAEDHDLCLQVLQGLSGWVRHLIGLIEDITLRDAAGRVARHLLGATGEDPDRADLPAAKKHLASHLNLTSETLSRTLRRLTDAGLIVSAPGATIRIRDREGLESAAQGLYPEM